MSLHEAKECGCSKEIGMTKERIPQFCEHQNLFVRVKQLGSKTELTGLTQKSGKKRKPLKRTQPKESTAEQLYREEFNEAVKAWPCLFSESRRRHVCDGELDAHHLVPKNFLRFRLSDWSERDLLEVLFHPHIGAPLCRRAHELVTVKAEYVYWDELSPECLDFVSSLPDFVLMRLEKESPKRKLESPSGVVG
jgi:hypothetical protein